MFKKPLAELKTSAPLRSSDRRKLKQRVLQAFPVLQPEDGDLLVPDGLLSQKFSTHLDEPGVVYISPEGDPVWFSVGKGSDDLIPTVYTLWKRPDLLPFLSTPSAVVPKLIGGADLMIPGVVQHSPGLSEGQLVSITQYHRGAIGPPLAVGRMAVPEGTLRRAADVDVKGKAVYVLHTWRDSLWEMGPSKKADVPEPRTFEVTAETNGQEDAMEDEDENSENAEAAANEGTPGAEKQESTVPEMEATATAPSSPPGPEDRTLTAEDVSNALRLALLQAISSTLAFLPPPTFPISASTFWSSYVLPARPVYIPLADGASADASAVDVKHSTYKSVKMFLKASAKEGLIKLKDAKGGDVMVTGVNVQHPAVAGHRPHLTVKDIESKREKAGDRERKEREAEERRKGEIQVTELYKPFGNTVPWFVAAEKDTSELYTLSDIKTAFNAYVSTKQLVNPREQQYINVGEDPALRSAVTGKSEEPPEFLKREDVLSRLKSHMQSWYEIKSGGQDVVRKKGQPKPVSVVMKIRQGRKACTLVTGFELFKLDAQDLAEELRKLCASSTSVSPVHGKASDMEVMVQGKQIGAVTDLLVSKGVPKKWIESADLTAEKKKK
ncbi:eukaryotic translation initiation factor SUI1 family protein [Obba rivulosa]|uniref:Eukaryotic translation initiation factor SUI1 family protein n=1 Tax=Obba rivulosa TaxID=1052685 RepID=A0A8E2AZS6_9APHY|nr:eukaryotic translation initiation factor SUI1 family protein [Obba rivulosa]